MYFSSIEESDNLLSHNTNEILEKEEKYLKDMYISINDNGKTTLGLHSNDMNRGTFIPGSELRNSVISNLSHSRNKRSKSLIKSMNKDQLRTYKENKTFSSIAKERKFKVYTKNSMKTKKFKFVDNSLENVDVKEHFIGGIGGENIKENIEIVDNFDGQEISILHEINSPMKELDLITLSPVRRIGGGSIHISTLSPKEERLTILENIKSNMKFRGGDTGTFLTDKIRIENKAILKSIPKRKSPEKHDDIYNKIFNSQEEADVFNTLSIVPITAKGENKGGKIAVSTIDPDFFLLHEEKQINKKNLINFNTNPGVCRNIGYINNNSDLKLKKKKKFKFYAEEIEENFKKLNDMKIKLRKHDSIKEENLFQYADSFNKFKNNKMKIQSDFKDLIFNTGDAKGTHYYDRLNTIKDVYKNEVISRSNKKLSLNGKLPSNSNDEKNWFMSNIDNHNSRMNNINLFTGRSSVSQMLRSLKEVSIKYNIPQKETPIQTDKNIQTLRSPPLSHHKREKSRNIITDQLTTEMTTRSRYRSTATNLMSKMIQTLNNSKRRNDEKSVLNIVSSPDKELDSNLNTHKDFFKNNKLLIRKMNFQDKKISEALKMVYKKEDIEKTLKNGVSLKDTKFYTINPGLTI
jgi:hypothetical protein